MSGFYDLHAFVLGWKSSAALVLPISPTLRRATTTEPSSLRRATTDPSAVLRRAVTATDDVLRRG